MARIFTRPGYSTITVDGPDADSLDTAYAVARAAWEQEGREKAAVLRITADEYARLARRGLVAAHIEQNARAYANRPHDGQRAECTVAVTTSLFRQAADAHEEI